ncbi:MAG: helix-turn-helix domain-containing protein [Cellvibrionaceae bacterium]|nr:helix-turn-helix domain-containing protein [Cellvibrionaceae bacterium]
MKTIHSERYRYLLVLLREAREAAGVTQAQLSEKLGKPQSYVSKYENGDRRLDLIEMMEVCQRINADPHVLIDRVRDKE